MGKARHLLFAAAAALLGLAACATLAGLEEPDRRKASTRQTDGGGAVALGEGVVVQPGNIALVTSCTGAASETPALTIDNQSNTAASYVLEVPEGSPFTLLDEGNAPAPRIAGTVGAKQSVSARLRATATKAGSFSGQVFVSVGEQVPVQVPVQVTVNGAELAVVPALVDFGEVRQQTAAPPQTIEVENTGTEAVSLVGFARTPAPTSDAGADFTIALPSSSIGPGQKATATATFLPGDAGPPLTTTFEARTTGPACGQLPTVTLKGTRVNQDVTINPASINFGEVDCLSAGGATKAITISNYANIPFSFDASTPTVSWYSIAPAKGTVPAASGNEPGTIEISVTLKPLGADIGDHSEPIQVNVASPQPKTTTVTATVKSVGAILTIEPTSYLSFTNDQTRTFKVRNVGNKFVYTKHTSSSPGAFAVVNGTNDNAIYPGSIFPSDVDVKFVAQQDGRHSAEITTTRANSVGFYPVSGTICQPPPVITVRGTRSPD
ncbi:MAG TPA: choice-of-anchor D domain-containing protein [Labilithrix sp.]|nr:choice-of-anchor D domain-containing protein [Labilithrix sp.]